jgi:hypothetical protein
LPSAYAALLKATLFDNALFGVTSPSDEEIVQSAGDAVVQILALMEAGRF